MYTQALRPQLYQPVPPAFHSSVPALNSNGAWVALNPAITLNAPLRVTAVTIEREVSSESGVTPLKSLCSTAQKPLQERMEN